MIRMACRIPTSLKGALDAEVIQSGYGRKGRSKWIRESLDLYFLADKELKRVGVADDLYKNDAEMSIWISQKNFEAINESVWVIRSQDPYFEGIRSAVVRAAIRWKLQKCAGE